MLRSSTDAGESELHYQRRTDGNASEFGRHTTSFLSVRAHCLCQAQDDMVVEEKHVNDMRDLLVATESQPMLECAEMSCARSIRFPDRRRPVIRRGIAKFETCCSITLIRDAG